MSHRNIIKIIWCNIHVVIFQYTIYLVLIQFCDWNKCLFEYCCNTSLILCSVVTVIWLLNICEIFLWGVVEERNISLAHIGHCPRNLLTFSLSHHHIVSKSTFVESPNSPSIFSLSAYTEHSRILDLSWFILIYLIRKY